MATSSWGSIVKNTQEIIAGATDGSPTGITPTYDSTTRWRYLERPRPEPDKGGRTREFSARRWVPMEGVNVFGGGEDQLGRDLLLECWYLDAEDYEDRRHFDEQDLITTLENPDNYPSGSTWALYVRRVIREAIETDDESFEGHIKVTIPVRHIWREAVSHI